MKYTSVMHMLYCCYYYYGERISPVTLKDSTFRIVRLAQIRIQAIVFSISVHKLFKILTNRFVVNHVFDLYNFERVA